MGLFSKKENKKDHQRTVSTDERLAVPNGEVHDPVLTAVREQQPYEEAAALPSQNMSPSGALRDVFGNQIKNPDVSNPARSRDERPLDTIRAFEFSATGDERLRDQTETQRLGFRPRADFVAMPQFESNPYAHDDNVISLGDPNAAPVEMEKREVQYGTPQPVKNMNKKKGMFSRKKKEKN